MADPYASNATAPISNGTVGRVITPGATDLDPIAKAITLLTGGDVTIVPVGNVNGDTLAFVGLPAGWVSPYRVRRVTAATATVATVEG